MNLWIRYSQIFLRLKIQSKGVTIIVQTLSLNGTDLQKSYVVEKKSQINSIEKRVTRAILNKGLAESDLHHLMGIREFKFASGRARMRARQDIMRLLDGETPHVPTRHMRQESEDVITKVVNFILSSNNVVHNSYGVRNI